MRIFYRPSSYTDKAIQTALENHFGPYEVVNEAASAQLQLADYEDLDFQAALDNRQCWICAYSIRKALIRKHFLSQTVREYVAKNPQCVLAHAVPETWNLEVDFVEFLDDALDESFELRGQLEENVNRALEDRKWFILKPGMAERGAGLRLFSTIEELTTIFEENEPAEEDETEVQSDDESGSQADKEEEFNGNGIMTSDMRFFVVQEYMLRPLLLRSLDLRKFHIRAYVLCIGSIQVFVHKNMLLLSSAMEYAAPSFDTDDLSRHLTNTCYQVANTNSTMQDTVHAFWNIQDDALHKDVIWEQIRTITGQLFDAACSQRINFQTLPNAFEIFGLDYLVNTDNSVTLLEVNAYPDFSQTGESLKPLVDEVTEDMIGLVAQSMQKAPRDQFLLDDHRGFRQCLSKKIL